MKYTEDHEWLRVEDEDIVTIGITEHAASLLGDIVFVELPEVGTILRGGEEAVVIESVKAASEILAPIDGEVIEINEVLIENPALVNEDTLGEGWFFRMKASDVGQLDEFMDEDAYNEMIE